MNWEQYERSQEMPEECPVCGKANADENGDWINKKYPGFCSAKCAKVYSARMKREARGMAKEYAETSRLIARHNRKCEKCRGKSKMCRCSTQTRGLAGSSDRQDYLITAAANLAAESLADAKGGNCKAAFWGGVKSFARLEQAKEQGARGERLKMVEGRTQKALDRVFSACGCKKF